MIPLAGPGVPTSWAWDFDNNGTTDSVERNPTHIYTLPGNFSVKLTAGNAGGSNTLIIPAYVHVTDASPPHVTGPNQSFKVRTAMGTTIPMTISWAGSDPAGSAATGSQVDNNGATWVNVPLRTPLSRSAGLIAAIGRSYKFRVYAVDKLGHGGYTVGTAFHVARYQQTNTAKVAFHGAWRTPSRRSPLWCRRSTPGRMVPGRRSWPPAARSPGSRRPDRAAVWPTSTSTARSLLARIDLRAARLLPKRIVFNKTFSTPGLHTIKVVVAGTRGPTAGPCRRVPPRLLRL